MPWLAIDESRSAIHNNDYLAERSARAPSGFSIKLSLRWCPEPAPDRILPDHREIVALFNAAALSMVVWILKREVRAIGGCLGIHRR